MPVMPPGKDTNLTLDVIDIIYNIEIKIDDDRDPDLYILPSQQHQHKRKELQCGEVWKSEGIISSQKVNDVQNYFVCVLELNSIEGAEYKKYRDIPCFFLVDNSTP